MFTKVNQSRGQTKYKTQKEIAIKVSGLVVKSK